MLLWVIRSFLGLTHDGMGYPHQYRRRRGQARRKIAYRYGTYGRHGRRGRMPQHSRRSRRHPARPGRGQELVVYHGTPSVTNAASIIKDGFMVGSGNALGDGIYLSTDVSVAKSYARSTGVYLKCAVRPGKTCIWNPKMRARYRAWCQTQGVTPDNSAITAFLIQHGYRTVRDQNVIVLLAPQYANPTAWKRKRKNIHVLSVHHASDDKRIRV